MVHSVIEEQEMVKGCDSNDISNEKAELEELIVSVNLLFIVIIYFKRYLSIYCLMQGSCFICSDF